MLLLPPELLVKYSDIAKEQKRQANLWRLIALLLLLGVFFSAGYLALDSPLSAANQSLEDFLEYGFTRVPVVLVLAALSRYAAIESDKHRRREGEAERLAAELTAFRPFLAKLPEDERNRLIVDVTQRYFKVASQPPGTT